MMAEDMSSYDPPMADYDKPNTHRYSPSYSQSINDDSPSTNFPDDIPKWYKLASMHAIQHSSFSTNTPKQFLPRVCLPNTTKKDEQPYATFNDTPSDLRSMDRKDDTSKATNNKALLSLLAVGVIAVIVAIPVTIVMVLQREVAVITEGNVTMKLRLDEQFQENMTVRNSDLYLSTEKAICDQVDLAFTSDDSSLKNHYKLCSVVDLRNGSIVARLELLISGTFTVPANAVFLTIIKSTIGTTGRFGQFRISKGFVAIEAVVYKTGGVVISQNNESPITPSESSTVLPVSTAEPSVSTDKVTTATEPTSTSTETVTTATEQTSTSTETVTTTTEPTSTSTEIVTTTTEPTSTSTETVTTATEASSTSTGTVTTTTEPTSTSTETVTTTTEPISTSTGTVTTTTEPTSTSTETVTTTTEPTSTSTETVTTTTEPTSTSTETVTTTTEPISTSTGPVTTTTEPTSPSTGTVTVTTEPSSTSTETVIITTKPTSTSTGTVTATTEPTSTSTGTVTTTTEPISTSTGPVTTTTEPTSPSTGTVTVTTEPTSTSTETVIITTKPTSTSTGTVTATTEPTSTSTGTVTTTTEPTSTSIGTVTATTEPTSTSTKTVTITTEPISTSTGTETITTEPTSTSTGTVITMTEPTSTSTETVTTPTEQTSTSTETVSTTTRQASTSTETITSTASSQDTSTETVTTTTEAETTTSMEATIVTICMSNDITISGNTTFKEGDRYDITCTGNISTSAELHLYRIQTDSTEKLTVVPIENTDISNGSCYSTTTKTYSLIANKSQNGTGLKCMAIDGIPPSNVSSSVLTLRVVAADVSMALHLQNTTWNPAFGDATSPEFKSFADDIEQDMDVVYSSSQYSDNYIGSKVLSLAPGSVVVNLVVEMTLIVTSTVSAGNTITFKINIHDIVNNIAETIQSLKDSGKLNSSLVNTDTGDISGIITSEQDLPEDACSSHTDIVFLLDASGSIGAANFLTMKYFIQNFTAGLQIGTDALQLGVVKFDSGAYKEIWLNQYRSPLAISNAVKAINYTNGGTRIETALAYVKSNAFLQSNGGRMNATQVIILMTDGQSSDDPDAVADDLKDDGVIIACIGIGSGIDIAQLNSIAYNSSFVFPVTSFNVLIDVKKIVQDTSCSNNG